jgi:hypothetical protein
VQQDVKVVALVDVVMDAQAVVEVIARVVRLVPMPTQEVVALVEVLVEALAGVHAEVHAQEIVVLLPEIM